MSRYSQELGAHIEEERALLSHDLHCHISNLCFEISFGLTKQEREQSKLALKEAVAAQRIFEAAELAVYYADARRLNGTTPASPSFVRSALLRVSGVWTSFEMDSKLVSDQQTLE